MSQQSPLENPEQNPNDATSPRRDRRSGCFGVFLDVVSWVFSTLLIVVGAFLLIFGVLDFGPEARARTIFLLILVPLAIFALIRIGRNILDELRGGK